MAGAVDRIQRPLQAGPNRPLLRATAGPQDGIAAVGLVSQPRQVRPFGVVELQSAGERVEHTGRNTSQRTAFEFRVVLNAHAGERGYLAAPQPGYPALSGCG
jgi:hypothetical protein